MIDLSVLEPSASRRSLAAGEVLFRQHEPGEVLYQVVSGVIAVGVEEPEPQVFAELGAGELLGLAGLVSDSHHLATATARVATELRCWSFSDLRARLQVDRELDRRFLELARKRVQRAQLMASLSRLVGTLRPAARERVLALAARVELARGERLFRQGDEGSDWYIVVQGRLGVSVDGREVAALEMGSTVGEVAALVGGRRNATVVADRETVLARFSEPDLAALEEVLPGLVRAMAMGLVRAQFTRDSRAARRPCRRVAVVACRGGARSDTFFAALTAAAARTCRVLPVTAGTLASRGLLGDAWHASVAHPAWLRVRAWLDVAETQHDLALLHVPDPSLAAAEAAIAMADHVLWVADAEVDPVPRVAERRLLDRVARTRGQTQQLLLQHPPSDAQPRHSERWLRDRPHTDPLHIRRGHDADLDRVARLLARRPNVLVLAGGGARGFAHLGVARALQEAAIPIDAVCGTSMGAIVAAQLALGRSHDALMALNRDALALRPFQRFTLPWTSLVSGNGFEEMGRLTFGDQRAEDLWLPFFATATGLSSRRVEWLDRGPLREILQASSAVPGVLPRVPWRGQLLVDGGVLDNLPVGEARRRWGGRVFAVDLPADVDVDFEGSRLPDGWRVVAGRVAAFGRSRLGQLGERPVLGLSAHARAPNLVGLLAHAMTLGSSAAQQRAIAEADVVFRPAVHHIGISATHELEALAAIGYRDAARQLAELG
jgi:predicted acylesterase/phospholipase RssA/CRP-like cAMP-binding protein